MATFFTADTHFGHANIINHCNRPFDDVWDMDDQLIENWNDKVSSKDTVYHLGDFFGNRKTIQRVRPLLNGRIILIPGNHDYKLLNTISAAGIEIKHPMFYRENNSRIWLSHYAHYVWPEMHRGSKHLYGHSHGSMERHTKGLCFDIGVDCCDYEPLSFQECLDRFSQLKQYEPHVSLEEMQAHNFTKFSLYTSHAK